MTRPLTLIECVALGALSLTGRHAPGVWMSAEDKALSDVLERLAKEGLCHREETEDGDVYRPRRWRGE